MVYDDKVSMFYMILVVCDHSFSIRNTRQQAARKTVEGGGDRGPSEGARRDRAEGGGRDRAQGGGRDEGSARGGGHDEGDSRGGVGFQARVTWQRTRAKAKAGNAAVEAVHQEADEDVFEDDEEPDIGKTLHAKDGKLGFLTRMGFKVATDFLVDIASQVYSETYSIKGI